MLEFIWPAIYVAAFYLFLNLKIAFEKLKLSLFMVYKASMLSYYAEGFKICIPSTMKTSTVQRHLDSFFFFYSPIEIHFTYHEIHPFKMYSQVVFSIVVSWVGLFGFFFLPEYFPKDNFYVLYCATFATKVLDHFQHLKKKPSAHQPSLPIPAPPLPLPQPQATTNLLSVCIDLPALYVSHKWNNTICGLLWLFSRCVDIPHFPYPFINV